MQYWWVNQKQTYKHEVPSGYMWSLQLLISKVTDLSKRAQALLIINRGLSPNILAVNQNQTYQHDVPSGYLWLPKLLISKVMDLSKRAQSLNVICHLMFYYALDKE